MFQANTPQARAVAATLSHKLHQLENAFKDTLVHQVNCNCFFPFLPQLCGS